MSPVARSGSGEFEVRVGSSPADRLLARCVGFDRSGQVTVAMRCRPAGRRDGRRWERWSRRFGDRARRTLVAIDGTALIERAGPIELHFTLDIDAATRSTSGHLTHVRFRPSPRHWRVPVGTGLGIEFIARPLPDGALDVSVLVSRRGRLAVRYEGAIR